MKLAIAMPTGGSYVHPGHAFVFFSLGAACAVEKNLQVVNFQLLDVGPRTLDLLVSTALEAKIDALLIIHPSYFAPPTLGNVGDGILRMLEALKDAAVIATPGPTADGAPNFHCAEMQKVKTGEVFEVDRVGHGIMAVNLTWLRDHWRQPPWFVVRREGLDATLDDWVFSEGVQSRGGKLLCDSRLFVVRVEVRFAGVPGAVQTQAQVQSQAPSPKVET